MTVKSEKPKSDRDAVRPGAEASEFSTWKPGEVENISLADRVYQEVLSRIVRGEFKAGDELKSTKLAKSLEVSRTPVVQALARLAADGIVTHELNQRAVVRPGADNWLVDVHEMRLLLEPQAAERAATRMPSEAVDHLFQRARRAEPNARPDWIQPAQEFDFSLHLAIAEHCGNLPMQQAIHKCWSYKRLSYGIANDTPESLGRGYREHMAILEAIACRDGRMSNAAMLYHLQSASRLRPSQRVV